MDGDLQAKYNRERARSTRRRKALKELNRKFSELKAAREADKLRHRLINQQLRAKLKGKS